MQKKKKKYQQTGCSIKEIDKMFDAKKPGWRISESGKPYFENRRNRSDVRKHL